MAYQSYWDENKQQFIFTALLDYKEKNCPSAGFNILRYVDKGVIAIKSDFNELASSMFAEFGFCNEDGNKYAILRLAKLGALEWNGV
jgi:hypothetical protein